MAIMIDGKSLTLSQVEAVARGYEKVQLTEEAKNAVNKARAYVEKKLDEGTVIYGLTTGFGKFSDTFIPADETAQLQRNLIISHSCGMGEPLPTEAVRAAMLLRCNALSRGHSGIRLSTIQTLLDMLNSGVHPIIPEKGSLGASGDLAPLSHMVLVMLGEGEAEFDAAIVFDTSIDARRAEAEGVKSLYTVTTSRVMTLEFHEVFRRQRDGKIFRVTSDGDDKYTPRSTPLDMRQVTAEEWRLPNG